MKSDLQDKLVEILGGIQGAVSKGSDFVLTQLPDVAQQYVAFGRVWCFVDIAMCGVILYVGYRLIKYAITSKAVEFGDWAFSRLVSMIAGAIVSLVGFVAMGFAAQGALLVWLAPKVWLLKEIASLVRH